MSTYRATHVQAPNFAFNLAARKWRARQPHSGDDAVDLSPLRHLFNAVRLSPSPRASLPTPYPAGHP